MCGEDLLTVRIKSAIRRFIADNVPEELDFFDPMWEAFLEYLSSHREQNLRERAAPEAMNTVAHALGLVGGEAISIKVPRLLAVVAAAYFHLAAEGRVTSENRAKELIRMYGEELGLERSSVDSFAAAMSQLLVEETSRAEFVSEKRAFASEEMLVVESVGEKQARPCSEKERLRFLAHAEKYVVLVDDLAGKAWVKGRRRAVEGRRLTLLIYMAAHAGRFYNIDDLAADVWESQDREPPYRQTLNRIHDATRGSLRVYMRSAPKLGRVYVDAALTYCIIYKAGTYGFLQRLVGG